jgi:hypothetical protein
MHKRTVSPTYRSGFDLMCRRSAIGHDMVTCWSNSSLKVPPNLRFRRIDLFAMDLLRAELCFLRCEREELLNADFDGNISLVARIAPYLLVLLPDVETSIGTNQYLLREWIKLKTRCYWLNASFYHWRGRLSHNVSESREAETKLLDAIENSISCLRLPKERPVGRVQTPHLVSPGRKGKHWKELTPLSLDTFRNEIQASSLLLQTQEKFLDVVSQMDRSEGEKPLQQAHSEALASIGDTLHARYASPVNSASGKYSELVTDFLGEHGDMLLPERLGEPRPEDHAVLQDRLDNVLPTVHINKQEYLLGLQRPCILTILLCCLQTRNDRQQAVLKLIISLCTSITELSEDVRSQCQDNLGEINFCNESDSDSDEDSLDDAGIHLDCGNAEKDAQRSRMRRYAVFLRLLVGKVTSLVEDTVVEGQDVQEELVALVHRALQFLSFWFDSVYSRVIKDCDWMEDLRLFRSVQRLFSVMREANCLDSELVNRSFRLYTQGLIGIIRQQRSVLSTLLAANCDRHGRSVRAKILKSRADFVGTVCCDLGLFLSEFPSKVVLGSMERSKIFETTDGGTIAVLCESLLWLWNSALPIETSANGMVTNSGEYTLRLRVPVASAIVGLCGSASSTYCAFTGLNTMEENIGLAEFYDSDTSAIDWLADGTDSEGKLGDSRREQLIRVVGQSIALVSEVFKYIDEKEAVQFSHVRDYHTAHGPSFPLIVVRVLNQLADRLLLDFAEKGVKDPLWSDYPYGTRSTGRMLDSLLYKAYKCLHGFTLVNVSDGKESSGGAAIFDPSRQRNKPESVAAAAMLYRCVMRAYSQGRKSPPKLALDVVLAALPPLEETSQSDDIRRYLFSPDDDYSGLGEICSFVSKGLDWEATFSDVKHWVHGSEEADSVEYQDEALVVRRGLSKLISQGSIPQCFETGGEDLQRSSAAQAEEELSRKFFALVDCLSLDNAGDYEAWYKASRCLIGKADLVADRLGLSRGFSRSTNFFPSERNLFSEGSRGIGKLLEKQSRETHLDEGWTQCLGPDLSVYVTYSWSSFDSLQACSKAVDSACHTLLSNSCPSEVCDTFQLQVWEEIEGLRKNSDLVGWSQAWGGLFVSALRKLAFRCVRLALYILYKDSNPEAAKELVSEVTESLGGNLYSELMGSQVYGYPIHTMSLSLKRELAEASLSCFQKAVDAVTSSQDKRPTWDLRLMIGKVRELTWCSFDQIRYLNTLFLPFSVSRKDREVVLEGGLRAA